MNSSICIFCSIWSGSSLFTKVSFEPRHDKTNKMSVRPAKTQISLGIRPVWSESSLRAQQVAKDPSFLHADSEVSDQTGRKARVNRSLRWANSHFVGFMMSRLIYGLLGMNEFIFYHRFCFTGILLYQPGALQPLAPSFGFSYQYLTPKCVWVRGNCHWE